MHIYEQTRYLTDNESPVGHVSFQYNPLACRIQHDNVPTCFQLTNWKYPSTSGYLDRWILFKPGEFNIGRSISVCKLGEEAGFKVLTRRSQTSRPHVLVVDDDPRHGQLLNLLEENLAIKVFNVHSCAEALSAVKDNQFDLILMDYSMPERNGIECVQCLKKQINTTEMLPVIAVTGHASDEVRQICLKSGMDDFLAKPFTINALQAIIDKHLPASAGN